MSIIKKRTNPWETWTSGICVKEEGCKQRRQKNNKPVGCITEVKQDTTCILYFNEKFEEVDIGFSNTSFIGYVVDNRFSEVK